MCKLCECWAVICIGECKLRSAFSSFTVVASRVGAPGISPKINGGPVEQGFPSVKHKRFFSISRARVRAVGPKIKGDPVQQAFPSVKYKRFCIWKAGRFACKWLKVHLIGESKHLQRRGGGGGGNVLSNGEGKKNLGVPYDYTKNSQS